jgi:large subunit ribosomal protein L33
MNKYKKATRIIIFLECLYCFINSNLNKRSKGISRYLTTKNRKNNTEKLELFKYCRFCNKHTIHKEIK